jgi:AcrR family transcriptional regulator
VARLTGQIDIAKNEAILDAAVLVLGARGVTAPMEEIARRACVSKQTIYIHYGSKAELVRAITARRVHGLAASLETPGAAEDPAAALAGYARVLLHALRSGTTGLLRMAMLESGAMPDVARAMYEAGPLANRARLAAFLRLEAAAGRIACADPVEAAQFFVGMVIGINQYAALLDIEERLTDAQIDRIAAEAAARFLRAYAP